MVDHDFGEMPGADDLPPHPDDPISDFRKQRMINAGMAARTEAADYYRHAAARGHPRAQGRLGEMYRTGNAVPRNRDPPICGCPARWPAWRQRLTGQTGPPRARPTR